MPTVGNPFPVLIEVEPAVPAKGEQLEKGPVYRAQIAKDGPPTLDGVRTCWEIFETSCRRYPESDCLGHRELINGEAGPFRFSTYRQVEEHVVELASAYARIGLEPKQRVGVLGANCKEWMIALQAMNRQSLVCVPLYETLGDNAIQYIIEHSGSTLVLVSASKLPVLAKAIPKVKHVVVHGVIYWGNASEEHVQALKDAGVVVRSWAEALELGAGGGEVAPVRPSPDDLCTIMYTSGTTGDPKGVMINHGAVVSTIASIKAFLAHFDEALGPTDTYLSYLPLAHIFDRVTEELMLAVGGSIGYWQGDIKQILSDVTALRPTLFAGVPRVFERIYNGINDQVQRGGFLKKLIFRLMYARKRYFMQAGYRYDEASWISDRLAFNKIKARLGGRVRVIVSGGAPLSPAIEEFLRVTMCAPVVQGYGLTETCAASFIADPFQWDHIGTVGAPQPCTELRLEAVPELGYSPNQDPPRGEVCIRGPGVFSGYYRNEAMTKEVVDSDGFFHTGDIGEITADGALRIIDRKKNIFKLSHGEYIAVEKVEGVYKACGVVEQVWVYGDSKEACLVAVVVPVEKPMMEWAAGAGVQGDFKAVCAHPKAQEHVLATLNAHGRANKLNSLELIKALHLEPEPFSVENDLMTPTFKLKRAPLAKRYKQHIDAMYARLAAAASAAPAGAGGGGTVQLAAATRA